jgi:multidrug efflux pump subunit AcrA (membrane-fusion protein)
LEDNQGRYVFVTTPQDERYATIERKAVEIGDVSSFGIEVLSGLSTGDEVVTAGMSQITPGMHVSLMVSE